MSVKKEFLEDKNLYKFKFQIFVFNKSHEVVPTWIATTKATTHKRLYEIIKAEMAPYGNHVCFQILKKVKV